MTKETFFEKMNKLLTFYGKCELNDKRVNSKFSKEEYQLSFEITQKYTPEIFEEIVGTYIKRFDYFTIARLRQLCDETDELEREKKRLNLNSFDELYEN